MKHPNRERTGDGRRFDLGGPSRSPLPEAPLPAAGPSRPEVDEEGHRARHHLHRFFEELLRRADS